MHKLHVTEFAHRYTHPHTGKHFYVYGPHDCPLVYFKHETGEVKHYVKAANTLADLKKFYTLTQRNVLVVIHSLSGRMVRLATDPEDWGVAHTVKEEGLRIHAEAKKRIDSCSPKVFDGYDLHVSGMSTDAIDRLRRDLIGAGNSVRTAHLQRAAKVGFNPRAIPTMRKLSDYMPSFVPVECRPDGDSFRPQTDDIAEAFMMSLKSIEADSRKKQQKEAARQLKDHIEKAIYQSDMPPMVAQIHLLDRAHAFDWAMQCVERVLEGVVEGDIPLLLD